MRAYGQYVQRMPYKTKKGVNSHPFAQIYFQKNYISQPRALAPSTAALAPSNSLSRIFALPL